MIVVIFCTTEYTEFHGVFFLLLIVIQSGAKDLEGVAQLIPIRRANEAFRGKTKCLSVLREGSQVLLATECRGGCSISLEGHVLMLHSEGTSPSPLRKGD